MMVYTGNSDVVPVADMPAWRLRDQEKDRQTVLSLLTPVAANLRSLLDIRYGVGNTARLISTLVPDIEIYGIEIDQTTIDKAWKPSKGGLFCQRYDTPKDLPLPWRHKQFDLLLGEFSNVTKHNRKPLDDALGSLTPRYLLFADVSMMRLHLHYKTYGFSQRCTLEEYWNSWVIPNYTILSHQRAHSRCSFGLFERV